ncbi:hypothetical protein, partial [Cognatishimia sp. MH4019]|uniref:hypothetical protein n=1 Tax=Cognatishimia sp. MH4019 TaxID=2854030 RepID=UPI001CD2E74C
MAGCPRISMVAWPGSERTVWIDFVEKLFFSDALVCVIALIYWDVRSRTALLLKGWVHRLELCQ